MLSKQLLLISDSGDNTISFGASASIKSLLVMKDTKFFDDLIIDWMEGNLKKEILIYDEPDLKPLLSLVRESKIPYAEHKEGTVIRSIGIGPYMSEDIDKLISKLNGS